MSIFRRIAAPVLISAFALVPALGSTQAFAASGSGNTINMVATAYGPSLQDNYPYGPVDAFGMPLVAGDVAVDPRVIPLGTRLYVSGYHTPYLPAGGFYAVARDTGGAIKGDRIDIFINGNASEVSSFGVQHVTITVLGKAGTGSVQGSTVKTPAASTSGGTVQTPNVNKSSKSATIQKTEHRWHWTAHKHGGHRHHHWR